MVPRSPWLRPTPDYGPVERLWNASLFSEASGTARVRANSSRASGAWFVRMFGLRHGRGTGHFGVGGTIPTGVSRCWIAEDPAGPATEHAESEGAAEQRDEADEAQGGTRTASGGAALCAPAGGTAHRFAAYRECSADVGSSRGAGGSGPSMIKRHMYVLAVPNLARSSAFYRDVLGFDVRELGPGWLLYSKDGCQIMAGECADAIPPRELGDHSYFGYLVVDDVDECYRRVTEANVEVGKSLRNEPWGMREFGLRTADGHRIMIGSELSDAEPGRGRTTR